MEERPYRPMPKPMPMKPYPMKPMPMKPYPMKPMPMKPDHGCCDMHTLRKICEHMKRCHQHEMEMFKRFMKYCMYYGRNHRRYDDCDYSSSCCDEPRKCTENESTQYQD